MNFKKFINSDYLKSNPLCGIDTYKDELNLATGACTRQIKKYVITGQENWQSASGFFYLGSISPDYLRARNTITYVCTHYTVYPQTGFGTNVPNKSIALGSDASNQRAYVKDDDMADVAAFKSYLQQQYANGIPVTIWFVLATPETETITVPTGLSGTEEGYLNQSGTPTPTNPIYPTANTVEKWFDLNHHIMGVSDWQTVASAHERNSGAWT